MGAAKTDGSILQLEDLARKEIEKLSKQIHIEFNYEEDEQHKRFVLV